MTGVALLMLGMAVVGAAAVYVISAVGTRR